MSNKTSRAPPRLLQAYSPRFKGSKTSTKVLFDSEPPACTTVRNFLGCGLSTRTSILQYAAPWSAPHECHKILNWVGNLAVRDTVCLCIKLGKADTSTASRTLYVGQAAPVFFFGSPFLLPECSLEGPAELRCSASQPSANLLICMACWSLHPLV